MRILFVCDNLASQTNGTTITTMRFARALEERGHQIYFLTNELEGDNVFTLETRNIPIVSHFALKQKTTFAKPNKEIIEKALDNIDLVHIVQPWKIAHVAYRLAKKRNIPVTMAFHVQPDHMAYGANMPFLNFALSRVVYYKFRKLYKKGTLVHCPSMFVANQLMKYKYPNQFRVISNGVLPQFYSFKKKLMKVQKTFKIVSVGRYSVEKNQQILIKAIAKSSLKDKIELYLPGSGPREKALKKLSNKLGVNTHFGFVNQKELITLLEEADLYVHPAIAETEAISCIEAIASGNVVLIGNSSISATPQFALDEKSLFNPRNADELKNKMEYLLLNPELRYKLQQHYYEYGQKFRIDVSIDLFEDMLNHAIVEHKNANRSNTKKAKEFKKWLNPGKISQSLSFSFYYLIVFPLLMFYFKFIMRTKFVNVGMAKKNINGGIIISNHVHQMDSPMSGVAFFPRRLTYTSIKANFNLKVAGKLVQILGGVPIPTDLLESRIFFHELVKLARQGKLIHFFPEGELIQFHEGVRPLKRGAFKVSVESSVPVIPVYISFKHYKTKIRKKEKYKVIYKAGMPIYPDLTISTKDAIDKLAREAETSMNLLSK